MILSMKSCVTITCCATSKISQIFQRNSKRLIGFPKNNFLSEYEKAIGYTHYSRIGSRNFNTVFGTLIEEIYDTSEIFNKFNKKSFNYKCDGYYKDEILYESKSRFNTMKSSLAVKEIESKLFYSVEQNKKFILLVLNDDPIKFPNGQNIPLHNGHNLKQIEKFEGYNKDLHRWISGNEVYKLLWPNEWKLVKKKILEELHNLSGSL